MKMDLTDTTSSKINNALVQGRRAIGTPAVGMVLTLVIVTDEEHAYDALKAANEASREHPSRKLVVIKRVSRSPRDRAKARLDAEVRVGTSAGTGETVVLRLYGDVIDHAQSVVLPLLLPDAPVVAWWPVGSPTDPAKDPLGALAQRRVTDAYTAEDPIADLTARSAHYTPGDTDLAWTRTTPWRSMLAAALDQQPDAAITSAEVEGEPCNPTGELLAMWLADRLQIPVDQTPRDTPYAITSVRLRTKRGPIVIDRPDGALATLSMPGQPDRTVALKKRTTAELLAEELRHFARHEMCPATIRPRVQRAGTPPTSAAPTATASTTADQRRDSPPPAPGTRRTPRKRQQT
ncbi:glucose-6-phosphate dehydrogenase assembly protein OpcA [Streptomyces klenkii]|uniref:glucose-6-phosphate dehydrogenase assembly protein OpcA n=1 Tax=Streptomyces klenkii TaxID=1420899 RepID=UPI00343D4FA7